jgi:RNA polymerase sigma factor for flagellar operon FliA
VKANPYADKSQQSREQLVLKYAPLLKRIVSRMASRFPPEVDSEEVYQAGMIGLLDAVDKFDSSRDIQFQTYAEYRIKGSILDELRALDWVPRGVRAAATEWERAWNEQCSFLGREPSDTEMATKLEMPLNEYHDFVARASPLSLVTLDHLGGSGEEEEGQSLLDILRDPDGSDPFSELSMHQLKSRLQEAILELTDREQTTLSLYYVEELNMKEVAAVLGVGEARVSQLHTKIILKLRAKLRRVLEVEKTA